MRLLFITDIFPDASFPNRGIFIRDSMSRMAELHEVHAVVPTQRNAAVTSPANPASMIRFRMDQDERYGSLTVHRVAYFHNFLTRREFLRALMMLPPAGRRIRELRKTFAFDVIVGIFMVPGAFLAAKFAGEYGVPCVSVGVGSDINLFRNHFMLRDFVKHALRRSELVLLNTRGLVENCVRSGADPGKIRILHFAVDCGTFHLQEPPRPPNPAPVIAMVANMVGVKRPLVFAKALEALHRKGMDFRAEVAGDGFLRPEFEAFAERAGYRDKIVFHGIIGDRRQIAGLYQRADVTVLTSHAEGLPFALLESMSCGTPVAASDLPGIREIVIPGTNGFLVPPEEVDGYAAAIEKVLAAKFDRKAVAASVSGFSWEKHTAAFTGYLEEAVRIYERRLRKEL